LSPHASAYANPDANVLHRRGAILQPFVTSIRRHKLFGEVLLNVLRLPTAHVDLVNRVPIRVLHEEVWRGALSVGHIKVCNFTRALLDKLPQRWVVRDASAADVQHGAREVRCLLCLCRATAHAFSNEGIILPDELGKFPA
jgi:hypothetical protein